MIPTETKSPLSHRLSYPLGAQVVSEALAGVPQYDQLRLRFRDGPDVSAMRFQAILRESRPYVALRVSFDRRPVNRSACNLMIARGWYDKQWELVVYPVLREHRHAARTALLDRALPAVRNWLCHPAAAGWETGHRRLDITFDPAAAAVTVSEFGQTLS